MIYDIYYYDRQGRCVGLFDRHEVGLFVPFHESRIEDGRRWADLWNQAVATMKV